MRERTRYVAGAGLLALDVVMTEGAGAEALTYAGGTCGNVLAILSFLHWRSTAIGFVGADDAGDRVLEDLDSVGVDAANLAQSTKHRTPIFVQRLRRDEQGHAVHRFSRNCPNCGQSFGSGHASAGAITTPIQGFACSQGPDVFFMDRLSKDILSLAASAKRQGAVVFYEPSVRADAGLWEVALSLADIVKYSADRFDSADLGGAIAHRSNDLWEIQTLGGQGLRYRRHLSTEVSSPEWSDLSAVPAPRVVDTCGAGDWCSAGLLFGLFDRQISFEHEHFLDALRLGQALAAWACAFIGARGAMYCSDRFATLKAAGRLAGGLRVDVGNLSAATQGRAFRTALSDSCSNRLCGESAHAKEA
jgi:fructokinase